MIANQKYRINALAKDFNMKSADIVTMLKEHGIEGKTHMAVLEPEEFGIIIELLTQQNQVTNMSAYLAGQADVAPADRKKPAPKAEPVKAEVKTEEKTPEVKTAEKVEVAEQKPATEQKAEEKTAAQTQQPQRDNRPQQAQQPQHDNRPQQAQQPQRDNRPQQTQQPQRDNRTQQNQQPQRDNRTQQNQPWQRDNRPQQGQQPPRDRSAQLDRFQNRPQQTKPADKKRTPAPQPQQPQRNNIIRTSGAGESMSPTGRAGTRVVDTRTVSVDLSKYDERLESFVPDTANYSAEKQKLKKKNTQQDSRTGGKTKSDRDKERIAMEKMRREAFEKAKKQPLHITIPDEIVVSELATRLKVTVADVIKRLMGIGQMATVNDVIDFDMAKYVAEDAGAVVTREVVVTIEERLFDESDDSDENLTDRSPVVCVMGHVDHGKTSLLDRIRHTHVTSGEAGGITQHIGAYRVKINDKDITFLDTPGHEAFTAMRARGAKSTDIAILVVAADDGIMPQTVEAINHAKAAGVSIIIAVNKMDKPHANPDAVKQELMKYDLVPEEWGGDTIVCPVSALTGQGIDNLLEMILLVAEMKELKANPNRRAKGVIIESRLDKGRGPVATLLVQNGTLRSGDVVIAGTAVGRVRAMTDDKGKTVAEAGPSVPVEIIGLSEVPFAGDEFNGVEDEKMARELAEQRKAAEKEKEFKANARMTLDEMYADIEGGVKELYIIVKADVAGSSEAVSASLLKLSDEKVKIKIIHSGVGGIRESDVMLAAASQAIIIGFNVRPDKQALDSAERQGVDIRTYRIIYECIEEVSKAMKGMLAPEYREVVLGHAEVRQTIHVPNVGTIAGSYVLDGKVTRASFIRIVRESVIIAEDKISSLRRFKDDVKDVATGYECGIALDKFNDIRVGDILEAYINEEIKR